MLAPQGANKTAGILNRISQFASFAGCSCCSLSAQIKSKLNFISVRQHVGAYTQNVWKENKNILWAHMVSWNRWPEKHKMKVMRIYITRMFVLLQKLWSILYQPTCFLPPKASAPLELDGTDGKQQSTNFRQRKSTLATAGRKHMATMFNTWLPCPQEMREKKQRKRGPKGNGANQRL